MKKSYFITLPWVQLMKITYITNRTTHLDTARARALTCNEAPFALQQSLLCSPSHSSVSSMGTYAPCFCSCDPLTATHTKSPFSHLLTIYNALRHADFGYKPHWIGMLKSPHQSTAHYIDFLIARLHCYASFFGCGVTSTPLVPLSTTRLCHHCNAPVPALHNAFCRLSVIIFQHSHVSSFQTTFCTADVASADAQNTTYRNLFDH